MKLEKLQVGRSYYSVERRRMGNTTMSCDSLFSVRIVAVHGDGADVSWNGNRVQHWPVRSLAKLREHPPEWIRNPFDGTRCHVCRARKSDGHTDTCEHPRAVSARKRAAKAAAQ